MFGPTPPVPGPVGLVGASPVGGIGIGFGPAPPVPGKVGLVGASPVGGTGIGFGPAPPWCGRPPGPGVGSEGAGLGRVGSEVVGFLMMEVRGFFRSVGSPWEPLHHQLDFLST